MLDESTSDWSALAFEALRVLRDAACERERREVGEYDEPTVIFRHRNAGHIQTGLVAGGQPAALPSPLPLREPSSKRRMRHRDGSPSSRSRPVHTAPFG